MAKPNIWGNIGELLGADNKWSTRAFNEAQVESQNEFNVQEAEKARAFNANQADLAWSRQQEARSNAIQTQMQDLEKAGINPMLAGNLGGAQLPTVGSGASSAQATSSGRAESPDYTKQALTIAMLALGGGSLGKLASSAKGNWGTIKASWR